MRSVGGHDTPEIAEAVAVEYDNHVTQNMKSAKLGQALAHTIIWGPIYAALMVIAVIVAHALWQLARLAWGIS